MSMFDKIAKAVYGNQPDPARKDASDMEERRIARTQLVRHLDWAKAEHRKSPDSPITQAGVESAHRMLKDFDNQM